LLLSDLGDFLVVGSTNFNDFIMPRTKPRTRSGVSRIESNRTLKVEQA
jgi:hypothetical protein